MASAPNENTPLLKDGIPVDASPPQLYTKFRSRYCVWISGIFVIVIALVFATTIGYLIGNSSNENEPPKRDSDSNVLLHRGWPIDGEQVSEASVDSSLVNLAVEYGKAQLSAKQAAEKRAKLIPRNSSSYKHQSSIVATDAAYNQSLDGFVEVEAGKYLKSKGVTGVIHYGNSNTTKWANESRCNQRSILPSCHRSAYRTINGTCNNLKHPQWGAAMTPFRRILRPEYDDDVSSPRGGINSSLPSAETVSNRVHRPLYEEDDKFTVMLAVWGQFLDHDISATFSSRDANGTMISCCSNATTSPDCFPVIVDDEKCNSTCMEFVRSAPALTCSFGPREQINQVSSYIDASMVYGNTDELAAKLRTFNDGQLAVSYSQDGRILLPVSTDPNDGCNRAEEVKNGRYCFSAGDSRANENIHLTSMHLIFVRQHNRVAKIIQELNPEWDDEKVYQETRLILIAQVEHITYNEFLPIILGEQLTNSLKLTPQKSGFWTGYNDSIDVSVSNVFAAAAFRFAHTLIPRMMKVLSNDTNSQQYVEMRKMLFNPYGLHDDELDSIIKGAMGTPVEKADNRVTDQVTKHLFETENANNCSTADGSHGLDLVALNIQRGRDHGLPGYTKWRQYCGLSPVHSFDDLRSIFDQESVEIISKLYKSVDDIDLYTGALSETPIEGGFIGATLTCLIADQFYRLKYGDRYWYETNDTSIGLNSEQLDEIRKTSLAGVICENADDLETITPSVMKTAGPSNVAVSCRNLPQPDYTPWKDFVRNDMQPVDASSLNITALLNYVHIVDDSTAENTEIVTAYNITSKNIEVRKEDNLLQPPLDLPYALFKHEVIVWKVTEPLVIKIRIGSYEITLSNIETDGVPLSPHCEYYSRILPQTVANNSDQLFDVSHMRAPVDGRCTVVAPIVLHGVFKTPDIFVWNGEVTVYLRKPTTVLAKEEELSLFVEPKHSLRLRNTNGELSIHNRTVWNGALPAFFKLDSLGWYSYPHTFAYPVFWSGVYDESTFDANFLLTGKGNNSYYTIDGMFTVDLSLAEGIASLVSSYRTYQSVVCFTESARNVRRVDVTQFEEITDWDPRDVSFVILEGKFIRNRFFWSGDIAFVPAKYPPTDPATSQYRPHGKYYVELESATLFAALIPSAEITKWWSGLLPENVTIPVNDHERATFAKIFSNAIVWSYTNSSSPDDEVSGSRITFKTHGLSHLTVFGDVEFAAVTFFPDIWTKQLQSNVTYYSPLILQRNNLVHDVSSDLVDVFYDLRKPELGVFAPIMLLGTYNERETLFEWNLKCILAVEE